MAGQGDGAEGAPERDAGAGARKLPSGPIAGGQPTVILDPATSALLHRSEDASETATPTWQRHTVLRGAHVAEIGQRAAGP
jgi:hypothetical protein